MGMRFQYRLVTRAEGGFNVHKSHRGKTHATRRLPKEFDSKCHRTVYETHGPRTARVLFNMPDTYLQRWILMGKMN